jgi:nickel/cobalt transporter (NiCoT) family protein
MTDPRARLAKIRAGLTPREWARTAGMASAIVGLNVLGWGMLAAEWDTATATAQD